MNERILVTKEMSKALELQDLHANVLKEEKPEIVIMLEKIGFKFGKNKNANLIKPEDRNVI